MKKQKNKHSQIPTIKNICPKRTDNDLFLNCSVRSPSPDIRTKTAIHSTKSPQKEVLCFLQRTSSHYHSQNNQGWTMHSDYQGLSHHQQCQSSQVLPGHQRSKTKLIKDSKQNREQVWSHVKKRHYPSESGYQERQENEYLRRELERYKGYVREYESLAEKNRRLQESMAVVLHELQEKNSLENGYELHTTNESHPYSLQGLSLSSHEDQNSQNSRLRAERDYFERCWQEEVQNKNNFKMELESIASHLVFSTEQKLMMIIFQLQEKVSKLSFKLSDIVGLADLQRKKMRHRLYKPGDASEIQQQLQWQGDNVKETGRHTKQAHHWHFSKDKSIIHEPNITQPIKEESEENPDSSQRQQNDNQLRRNPLTIGNHFRKEKITLRQVFSSGRIQKSPKTVQIANNRHSRHQHMKIDDNLLDKNRFNSKRIQKNNYYNQEFQDGDYHTSEHNDNEDQNSELDSDAPDTLNLSFNRASEIDEMSRQNSTLKQQIQALRKEYTLQVEMNEKMSKNMTKIESQLNTIDRERRGWRDDHQKQNICQGKKVFNQVRDTIHVLNQKLQDRNMQIGSCLQIGTVQRLELQMQIRDSEHQRIRMQNQIVSLNHQIVGLTKQLRQMFIGKQSGKSRQQSDNLLSDVRKETPIDTRFETTQKQMRSVFDIIENCTE